MRGEIRVALSAVPRAAGYLDVVTEAQGLIPGWPVAGQPDARRLAAASATRTPLIVVYLDGGPRRFTAHAYLSAVFGPVGEDAGSSLVIGTFGYGRPVGTSAVVGRDSDLPAWSIMRWYGVELARNLSCAVCGTLVLEGVPEQADLDPSYFGAT